MGRSIVKPGQIWETCYHFVQVNWIDHKGNARCRKVINHLGRWYYDIEGAECISVEFLVRKCKLIAVKYEEEQSQATQRRFEFFDFDKEKIEYQSGRIV